ncbi:Helix-turn-helix domain of resolvase [Micromonospora matsumotoense]|uniref:Helix-turn-helix domain of resolvase n=1 Tax=Micromonospora matsumotoense TaxID=121616 RepID=A0A1C5AU55_9ACTN|nr:helix-turn-helix domain-containing protein [Micromonospora matsumotoense]SCF48730.1 Helix-turn-helix domain of resolvase [Micromonospora matsumotoense]
MVLRSERWLKLRRVRALHEAGLSLSQITRETGLDRKTVRKYLAGEQRRHRRSGHRVGMPRRRC